MTEELPPDYTKIIGREDILLESRSLMAFAGGAEHAVVAAMGNAASPGSHWRFHLSLSPYGEDGDEDPEFVQVALSNIRAGYAYQAYSTPKGLTLYGRTLFSSDTGRILKEEIGAVEEILDFLQNDLEKRIPQLETQPDPDVRPKL
jgi:hypothetical protein